MNQSTVNIRATWFWSILSPFSICTIVTKPPDGIPATVNEDIIVKTLKKIKSEKSKIWIKTMKR